VESGKWKEERRKKKEERRKKKDKRACSMQFAGDNG